MAGARAVFSVASHHWLCLSTVALSAPLLSAQWYTHKKTIFFGHDIACLSCTMSDRTVFFHHKFTAGCSPSQAMVFKCCFSAGPKCDPYWHYSHLKMKCSRRATFKDVQLSWDLSLQRNTEVAVFVKFLLWAADCISICKFKSSLLS